MLPAIDTRPITAQTPLDLSKRSFKEDGLLPELSIQAMEQQNNSTFISSQKTQKKRRGGWWDKSTNKELDMNHIKDMLRKNANTRISSLQENNNQIQLPMVEGRDVLSSRERDSETVAPAAEQQASQLDQHIKPSTPAAPMPPRKIKNRTKKIHRVPWKDVVDPPNTELRPVVSPLPSAPSEPSKLSTPKDELKDMNQLKTLPKNDFNEMYQQKTPKSTETSRIMEKPSSADAAYLKSYGSVALNPQNEALKTAFQDIQDIINTPTNHQKIEEITLFEYLQSINLEKTADCLKNEAKMPDEETNYIKLFHLIKNHDFGRAVVMVQQVLQSSSGPDITSLLPSFEDLMYVLSKFLLISLVQKSQNHIAERTLKMVIWPLVQKEQKRGGIRSEWFTTDYHLLENLVSGSASAKNIYQNFHWDSEISKFWKSIDLVQSPTKSMSPPLFAYALAKYFAPCSSKHLQLSHSFDILEKLRKIREIVERAGQNAQVAIPPSLPKKTQFNRREHRAETKKHANVPIDVSEFPQANQNEELAQRISEGAASSSIRSRTSYSQKYEGLPPIIDDQETSNFALSTCCGPSSSQIRVMDVLFVPETGQIIAITAGSDKDISVWDIRANNLLLTLNNNSNKPIVYLSFHPSFPELFLSADMEFDVKLWNWKEGTMVRWWKKHHSRIIYQLGFVPGDDTRAVSCSGDQSLKVWNIHADKTSHRGSIHANEPITSFVFCGSPSDSLQQKIVISLSYTIRIYKLRTLSLLHSITMKDLKLTKSPIINMQAHPMFDNYLLLSSDHQLRLFDLNTEAVIKTYSARVSSSEIRLRGQFSPAGQFVFAGSYDIKHGTYTTSNQNMDESAHELTGNLIWRVHSGKIEQREMNAMEETGSWEHSGKIISPTPVIASKWLNVVDKSKKNGERRYKIYVQAGLDKLIRLFLG